ncbi:MAG: ABC transporter substrate-binding protein [Rubrivivax sp.]|nr:ABC transporter substrate-binding protein [Rubrivivax sp.]
MELGKCRALHTTMSSVPAWGLERRALLLGASAAAGLLPERARAAQALRAEGPERVLRYALEAPESNFDPVQQVDQVSAEITEHILEPPLRADPSSADELRLTPCTLVALPEHSADYRRWTLRVRPGIFFTPDAAFGGRPRELTAADHAYALRRTLDPRGRGVQLVALADNWPLGMRELRERAKADRALPFYDLPVPGLALPDRFTLQVTLERPAPRFERLMIGTLMAAVAREVVEHYGERIGEHPVGTGPFVLHEWRRGSRIVLRRNPAHRDPPWLQRVEAKVIAADQPRWLAFLRGDLDTVRVPGAFADVALPGGQLAPYLVRRGVRVRASVRPALAYTAFNLRDPVVGGLGPAQVALRRAIGLLFDSTRALAITAGGLGVPAQSAVPPGAAGYDPALVTEMGAPSPARARALLDLHGFVDRDGDGWRERPDGQPLRLELLSVGDLRQRDELWQRWLGAAGLSLRVRTVQLDALYAALDSGRFTMAAATFGSGSPDADAFLGQGLSTNIGYFNDARFELAAFDALYARQLVLPDGPERVALVRQAARLLLAYVPYKLHHWRRDVMLDHPGLAMPPLRPYLYPWWSHVRGDDG